MIEVIKTPSLVRLKTDGQQLCHNDLSAESPDSFAQKKKKKSLQMA